jgi:hypothetical protein
MSTEIGILKESGSRGVELSLTRFWGGEKNGVCVQLTAEDEDGHTGYVQLSGDDILTILPILEKYIIKYDVRHQRKAKVFELSDEVKNE